MVTSTSGLSGEGVGTTNRRRILNQNTSRSLAHVKSKNSRWKTNHTQFKRKTKSKSKQKQNKKSKRIAQTQSSRKTILVRSGGEHVFTLQDLKPESGEKWLCMISESKKKKNNIKRWNIR
ncbi:hypothetical protein CEXT_767831 [Caerostris extrusa]|uniref:Uncharacterized protein n=1 Tax=Caerostris extrusa TaxID=172846 RepID=A0AAV4NIJ6_CAEEX|nr:hypothetical protein CEXT_767831 [Caerostris extrusa]